MPWNQETCNLKFHLHLKNVFSRRIFPLTLMWCSSASTRGTVWSGSWVRAHVWFSWLWSRGDGIWLQVVLCHVLMRKAVMGMSCVTRLRDREEEVVAGGLRSAPTYYLLPALRDCWRVERSEQCVPMHFMQMRPEAVCVSAARLCVCVCVNKDWHQREILFSHFPLFIIFREIQAWCVYMLNRTYDLRWLRLLFDVPPRQIR